MSRNKLKKTSLMTALVFSFALLSNLAAAAATANQKMAFSDVPANHWGAKDIIKLNLRRVVAGYSNGRFYPAKPVTQIEAVLLAVRNLEAESQMASLDLSQPIPVAVPEWVQTNYKREMLYALQKGLVVPSDNNFLATANATRAWVAQLLVRMINKGGEAELLATQTPSWLDAESIPEWALGAVNLVAKYKLVNGYQDNTFRPNGEITRAEITSLLSRSEQYLSLSGNTLNARVLTITGSNLTLLANGVVRNCSLNNDTYLYDAQGKPASLTSLQANQMVRVVLAGSFIKYLEVLPTDTVLSKLKGTVLEVLSTDKVVVVKDQQQKIHTIAWAATADTATLQQLTVGLAIELGLNGAGEAVTAVNVSAVEALGNSGTIASLNPEQQLLTIKNSSGKVTAYQYTEELLVKISGQRFPVITDFQVGDAVKFTTEAGVISELELVTANQSLKVAGTLVLYSAEKRLLAVQRADAVLLAFALAENVQLQISGLNYPQLSNVAVDDQIELVVEKGKVTQLTVLQRSANREVAGTVTAVDTTNRILTIKTTQNELKAFEVSTNADFYINDQKTSSLSALKKDMQIKLRLKDNKVDYVEITNTVEGTLVSIDTSHDTLVLKPNNLANQSYDLDDDVDVDIEGITSSSLSRLNKNDYLEIRIEDDLVTKINVRKVLEYTVVSKSISNNELKVKDSEGITRYLDLDRVELIVPKVDHPDISDFATGDDLKVTFLGKKVTKVEVVAD